MVAGSQLDDLCNCKYWCFMVDNRQLSTRELIILEPFIEHRVLFKICNLKSYGFLPYQKDSTGVQHIKSFTVGYLLILSQTPYHTVEPDLIATV